jgi:hypothetical protein
MKTKLKDASNIELYNASGEEMKVAGQSEIWVMILSLNMHEVLTFLVTPDLPNEEQVLLGIHALESLKCLPINWPVNLDFESLEKPTKSKSNKLTTEQINKIKTNQKIEINISEDVLKNLGSVEDIPRLKKLPDVLQDCIQ